MQGMIRFCWTERESSEPEDTLLLVPGDCSFSKVKGCPSGRVFSLAFVSSPSKKYYYWIQETEHSISDDEIDRKVNEILSYSPPEPIDNSPAMSDTTKMQIENIVASVKKPKKQPTLKEIFSNEDILLLCELPAVKQRLWHHLPATLRDSGQSLREIITSAPFKDALAVFDEVLRSGEINAIILSLGLDPAAGTSFGGVKRLLESIKHKVNLDKTTQQKQE